MAQVAAPQEKQIVELPLLFPCRFPLIFVQLLIVKAFKGFPLAPGLLENELLLVAEIHRERQLVFEVVPLGLQPPLDFPSEAEFGGSGAGCQFVRCPLAHSTDVSVDLFNRVTNSGHLLVRRFQAKFLLMFETLP